MKNFLYIHFFQEIIEIRNDTSWQLIIKNEISFSKNIIEVGVL